MSPALFSGCRGPACRKCVRRSSGESRPSSRPVPSTASRQAVCSEALRPSRPGCPPGTARVRAIDRAELDRSAVFVTDVQVAVHRVVGDGPRVRLGRHRIRAAGPGRALVEREGAERRELPWPAGRCCGECEQFAGRQPRSSRGRLPLGGSTARAGACGARLVRLRPSGSGRLGSPAGCCQHACLRSMSSVRRGLGFAFGSGCGGRASVFPDRRRGWRGNRGGFRRATAVRSVRNARAAPAVSARCTGPLPRSARTWSRSW